jgi:two-component system phosphate regulon sensor histidine kinase PhoR
MSSEFATGAVAGLLAAGLAGGAAFGRHSLRARDLERFAARIGQGDLASRCAFGDRTSRAFNAMADALAQRISALTFERDDLAAVFEGMAEGVLVADAQQQVLRANASAARLLDFQPPAQGRALWELVRNEALLRASIEAMEKEASREIQIGPYRDRHLTVSLTPLPFGGPPRRLLLVAHDTTESARYQELRKEFVANVSHELRTPLTLIQGYVETLRTGGLADPERVPEFLEVIDRNARLLTSLVENLLDLSRLESPEGLPRRVRLDPGALLRTVAELRRPAAERRKQSLETGVRAPLPPVLGDPDYLERALANLVDNAVKYTPEGGTLKLSAFARGDSVVLEVADTGIGIPETDLPRIFERFYRVDKSRSREMGGTGLGLAIVKHVVQAHGGSVEVTSRVGQGSTFRIVLPAARGA